VSKTQDDTMGWEVIRALDRAGLIARIVEAAEGRIVMLPSEQQGRYLFGRDKVGHAMCLAWGADEHVEREQIDGCFDEIAAAGLCMPFLLFGATTCYGDSRSRIFMQVPWCFERGRPIVRTINGFNLRGKPVPYRLPASATAG